MTLTERWAVAWPPLLAVTVVGAVGTPAAVASYRHARDVVASTGDTVMAPWLPLSVDGMLVAALVVIWVRRRRGQPAGSGPWAAFLFGMVVTIAANLAAVTVPSVKAYAVALFPPLALAITLELVALVAYRTRPEVREAEKGYTLARTPAGPMAETPRSSVSPIGDTISATRTPDPESGPPDPARTPSDPLDETPGPPTVDGGSDEDDDTLIDRLTAWAATEGSVPSRERVRIEFGIGTRRAARIREAVLTTSDLRESA